MILSVCGACYTGVVLTVGVSGRALGGICSLSRITQAFKCFCSQRERWDGNLSHCNQELLGYEVAHLGCLQGEPG